MDRTDDGRSIKMLTLIGEFTNEMIARSCVVGSAASAERASTASYGMSC